MSRRWCMKTSPAPVVHGESPPTHVVRGEELPPQKGYMKRTTQVPPRWCVERGPPRWCMERAPEVPPRWCVERAPAQVPHSVWRESRRCPIGGAWRAPPQVVCQEGPPQGDALREPPPGGVWRELPPGGTWRDPPQVPCRQCVERAPQMPHRWYVEMSPPGGTCREPPSCPTVHGQSPTDACRWCMATYLPPPLGGAWREAFPGGAWREPPRYPCRWYVERTPPSWYMRPPQVSRR